MTFETIKSTLFVKNDIYFSSRSTLSKLAFGFEGCFQHSGSVSGPEGHSTSTVAHDRALIVFNFLNSQIGLYNFRYFVHLTTSVVSKALPSVFRMGKRSNMNRNNLEILDRTFLSFEMGNFA